MNNQETPAAPPPPPAAGSYHYWNARLKEGNFSRTDDKKEAIYADSIEGYFEGYYKEWDEGNADKNIVAGWKLRVRLRDVNGHKHTITIGSVGLWTLLVKLMAVPLETYVSVSLTLADKSSYGRLHSWNGSAWESVRTEHFMPESSTAEKILGALELAEKTPAWIVDKTAADPAGAPAPPTPSGPSGPSGPVQPAPAQTGVNPQAGIYKLLVHHGWPAMHEDSAQAYLDWIDDQLGTLYGTLDEVPAQVWTSIETFITNNNGAMPPSIVRYMKRKAAAVGNVMLQRSSGQVETPAPAAPPQGPQTPAGPTAGAAQTAPKQSAQTWQKCTTGDPCQNYRNCRSEAEWEIQIGGETRLLCEQCARTQIPDFDPFENE